MLSRHASKVTCTATFVVAMLACTLLSGCLGRALPFGEPGSWTICIYVCGSNLETKQGWASKTIDALHDTWVPDNANVIVQVGGTKEWHDSNIVNGTRYAVEHHNLTEVGNVGEANMGDPSTLADFLTFCTKEYPAEHTAVILWDHGGGPLSGICYDELHYFDTLDLGELDEAFGAGVAARGGAPFDIIGFDACLMGSLETARILSDDAHWLVASEEIEPGAGWDYKIPIELLKLKPEPFDVATSICDNYYMKCKLRGKEEGSTLSVVDLSRVSAVEDALNDIVSKLDSGTESSEQTLRHFALGARYAAAFGGETKNEGRSNLIDIKGLASGNAEAADGRGAAWEALVTAVSNAVPYKVGGRMMEDAGGISLYYPLVYSSKELANYAKISPLSTYATALEKLYATSLGTISFADAGSISDDGRFHAAVAPESSDRFFDIYVQTWGPDGSYQEADIAFTPDWANYSYSYNPADAVAITLNGMVLDAEVISYDHGYVEFSAPVTIDGEDASLRIAWFENGEEEGGGHFELLGVWSGITHVTGVADRTEDSLSALAKVGARSLQTDEVRAEVAVGRNPEITGVPLPPGEYKCCYVVIDLMGREYRSNTCAYTISEDGSIGEMSIEK